ncbi:hypothetical protein NZA98_04995, partial [Escherichia coli]|nr:hypothetical protein [Escherichia coli]
MMVKSLGNLGVRVDKGGAHTGRAVVHDLGMGFERLADAGIASQDRGFNAGTAGIDAAHMFV